MSRRLLVTLIALPLGLAVADFCVGSWMLENGLYQGRSLPPFGGLTPARQVWLDAQRRDLAKGQDPPSLNGFDPDLGWTNRPGVGGRELHPSINSIGARGQREYPLESPQGSVRVACFGDSFVFGSQVADEDAWPAQLEALDPKVEAINFGVGGYGLDQALLRFRRKGLLGADAVVVGFMLGSIGRNVNRALALYHPPTPGILPKPRFILEEGELALVPCPFRTRREVVDAVMDGTVVARLAEHEYWIGDDPPIPFSTVARVLAAEAAYERRDKQRLWEDVEGEPFQVTLALLEAFRREALEAGAEQVLVLVFPAKSDVGWVRRGSLPYWRTLHEALESSGLTYIDFTQLFLDASEPTYVLPHLNRFGNAIVAEAVQGWLRGHG